MALTENSDPIVSVIMPVCNGGAYLRAAVDSILRQTYPAFELIVVDDGSTDGAVESLPPAPRLRVVSGEGRGVVAAMRTGVQYAGGDLIARMDADDIAVPARLVEQVSYLRAHPHIGIAGAQVEMFRDGELGGGFQVYQDWINRLCTPEAIERELFIESPLPNPTALFRREVYESLGGYRDSSWAEDYDLLLRAYMAGIRMGKPPGVLLYWRDHDARLTRRDHRYDNDRFMQAKGYYLARSRLAGRRAVIWGTGRCGTRFHDILVGQGASVTAFIDIHPRRVGGRKRGLSVLPAEAAGEIDGPLIVGAVRARGAREEIRAALRACDKVEGEDFIFAA